MLLRLFQLFIFLSMFGCYSPPIDGIYDSALKVVFDYIELTEGKNFFKNDICIVDKENVMSDNEFMHYFKVNYVDKGYDIAYDINEVSLRDCLGFYFTNVSECDLSASYREPLRRNIDQVKSLYLVMSPIFYSSQEDKYFITVSLPPTMTFDIQVSKALESKLIESGIK